MSLFCSTIISPKSFISPKGTSMGTTLKFYINKAKKSKRSNRYPIYLRILHNSKKSEGKISLTTISESDIQYWVEESQRFSNNKKKYLSHNILLNEIQNEFHNYLRDNLTEMNHKTPHDIRDYLLSRNKSESITVLEAANEFYNLSILPNVDKAPGTKRNYKKSINHFSSFLKYKGLEFLNVRDFKRMHALLFIDYLKTPLPELEKIGLNGQSVNSIVKNIKPIFNKLLLEEKINNHPFLGVKVSFKKVEKPRLSNKEFKKIVKLSLDNNTTLGVYRDIFLFLCYTGLSYCDAVDLTNKDIDSGYLELRRKKSNVTTKQFLIEQIFDIIDKYKNRNPEELILPKRSLDKLNLNLKLIAAKTGIGFSLSTYTARRFFRQSISESGINEGLVIKTLMGHTIANDIDSHYFYVSDTNLIKAKKKLQKHFKKLLK